MELRCNHCNKILDEFGCEYNADVTNHYTYNEEMGKFEITYQELNDDDNSNFYCLNCGKTLSNEIINMMEF